MASNFIFLPSDNADASHQDTTVLFTQTASVTIANTTVATSVLSTGVGSVTLPANLLSIGTQIRMRVAGFHSSTGNPSITVVLKLGATTIATSAAITGGNGSNDGFLIFLDMTCRTAGVSGTVIAQGQYQELHSNGGIGGVTALAPVTINTTIAQTIDVTFKWGAADAGNTCTTTNVSIEALN